MTIDEVIKVNKSFLDGTYDHRDEVMEAALKLNIVALGHIKLLREHHSWYPDDLLPGETRD